MSTAKFGIKISGDSRGGVQAIGATRKELKSLRKSFDQHSQKAKAAKKSNSDLTLSFSSMLGPIAGLVSVTAGLSKVIGVAREFDVLNAQLITATGSAKNAGVAFDAIKQFATTTPYDLQQATKAFTQLVNLGLTPSERALRSYGDTASAMGKDLSQLVEAVADASTGEFERLKEFGIKTKSEGDNVSFTFRGVTKTVKKEAAEIEGYLIGLGENNFAGAMSNRMETLDGKISNLGDSWDSLFLTIGQQDSGGLMAGSVELAIGAIQELEAMIASGQLLAGIEAFSSKFVGFGDDAARTLDTITKLIDYAFEDWGGEAESLSSNLTSAFSNMPENIRAFIQIMGVELANFVGVTSAYGQEIADNLTFWKDESFNLDGRLAILESAKVESISNILEEKDAAIKSFESQIKGVDRLREKYDELQDSKRAASGSDALEQFGISKSSLPISADIKVNKSDNKAQEKINSEVLQIQNSMRSQEQVIQDSYEKRKEIILNSTALSGEAQTNLLLGIENQRNEQLNEINAGFWENYLLSAQENLTSFDELSASTIENLSTGVGAALERMVFDSESFSDSMKNLMEGVARSTVGALGKMAAEWLAYKVVQKALGKSTQASAVGTMTANAKAMAVTSGINAFASTAAIPIIGPALAPGAMAAALSVTTPAAVAVGATAAAGLASFDGGGFTGSGSRSGGMDGKGGFIAMLHPNETVIDHTKNNNVATAQPRKVEITFNGSRSDVVTIGEVAELFNERINDVGVAIAINDSINNAKRTGDIDDE